MKSIDRLLVKILAASAVLFLISLVFSNKDKNAQKSIESAILNPKYKNDVAKIEISKNSGTGEGGIITLSKQGDFWLLSKESESGESICTIADSKIISSLIENAAKIRKTYAISEKISDYESLGLTEDFSTSISFLKNNSNLYTKVHFGYSDSLKNRIFLRSESSKTAYECENDFQQYLTAQTNYWSEGEILPEIKNPVKITLKINESSRVSPEKTVILDEKSPNFTQKTGTLLSLRHGNISVQKDFFSEEAGEFGKSCANLTIQDGNGRIARLTFYEKEVAVQEEIEAESSESSYFYTKSVTPSEIDNQETRFALYSENAAYEISEWTYRRILSVFGK